MSNSNPYTKTKAFSKKIHELAEEYVANHLGPDKAPNLNRINATPKRKQENPDNQQEI